jgi:hypothetical protein
VLPREPGDLVDVGHGDRLAAARVVRQRQHHDRDALAVLAGEELPEPVSVHIALERGVEVGVESSGDGQVERDALPDLDVRARRVEVSVGRDDLAWVDHRSEEDAFGAAALMRGDDEWETEDVVHRLPEAVEAPRAGIGLVPLDESRPLRLAHGAGPRVGQEVELDIRCGQLKDIPAGGVERALTLVARGRADGLDHLDPKRFARRPHRPPSV